MTTVPPGGRPLLLRLPAEKRMTGPVVVHLSSPLGRPPPPRSKSHTPPPPPPPSSPPTLFAGTGVAGASPHRRRRSRRRCRRQCRCHRRWNCHRRHCRHCRRPCCRTCRCQCPYSCCRRCKCRVSVADVPTLSPAVYPSVARPPLPPPLPPLPQRDCPPRAGSSNHIGSRGRAPTKPTTGERDENAGESRGKDAPVVAQRKTIGKTRKEHDDSDRERGNPAPPLAVVCAQEKENKRTTHTQRKNEAERAPHLPRDTAVTAHRARVNHEAGGKRSGGANE